MKKHLTKEQAMALFTYEKETGFLIWKRRSGGKGFNKRYANQVAGSVNIQGYVQVSVMGKVVLTHRIVWLMNYGYWPTEVDHINGNRRDNRLKNLREVTRQANMKNRRISDCNTSGVIGVSYIKKWGVWRAYICGKHLGTFRTREAAAKARATAEVELNFHPNHGRAA